MLERGFNRNGLPGSRRRSAPSTRCSRSTPRRPICARRCAASTASGPPPRMPTTTRPFRRQQPGRSEFADRVHALQPGAVERQELAAGRAARTREPDRRLSPAPARSRRKPRSPPPAPSSTRRTRKGAKPKQVASADQAAAAAPAVPSPARAPRRPRPRRSPRVQPGAFGPPTGRFTPPAQRAMPAVTGSNVVHELRARGQRRPAPLTAMPAAPQQTAAVPMPRPRPKAKTN